MKAEDYEDWSLDELTEELSKAMAPHPNPTWIAWVEECYDPFKAMLIATIVMVRSVTPPQAES